MDAKEEWPFQKGDDINNFYFHLFPLHSPSPRPNGRTNPDQTAEEGNPGELDHKAKMVKESFEEHNIGHLRCQLGLQSRSRSDTASVGCSRQTKPIHGGPTLLLTGVKYSAAGISVPHTIAHLQGSSGVRSLMVSGCFHSTVLGRRS